ncbi:DISARM system helicase DrmA [Acanthopleuribacter pedis]|uniref:DISARM system helicase DrmA n=1 Tax=Acanthopleuribacter pedis TaxID=442870 RepID=A0A8J7QTB5_9BACT|nr:DISARM system helicase DrmA [Acanthopleuribacter pedis]MBO1323213.1 DISARM system helicase DrmA [Acanthopleuribacter pedis]
MTTSAQVRDQLVNTLRLDLVGPDEQDPNHQTELLDNAPSRFYLTGFLIPYRSKAEDRRDDGEDDDDLETDSEDQKEQDDRIVIRRSFFPSSMGLTVLVPPQTTVLQVDLSWGDYQPEDPSAVVQAGGADKGPAGHDVFGAWRRFPRAHHLAVPVADKQTLPIADSGGMELRTAMRPVQGATKLPADTRAFSLYLVNNRDPEPGRLRDRACAFQAKITLRADHPLVARTNPRGGRDDDHDENIADIQYRDVRQYAVGHNVAVTARVSDGHCTSVATEWMPTAPVYKVDHPKIPELQAEMTALGRADAAQTRAMLQPLLDGFAAHLEREQATLADLNDDRRPGAEQMTNHAARVAARMQAGLDALQDPTVLTAFQIANRTVAAAFYRRDAVERGIQPQAIRAALKQDPAKPAAWRPFQIGFLLTNLCGLIDPGHADRELVDLLFFPTGGGKTEAYLGLAAFTLALRRLRLPGPEGGGLTVLMRYTLRLLTLDQMDRAAGLICAMEMERREGPNAAQLGERPFEIGLWVGQAATPNVLGKSGDNNPYAARTKLQRFQREAGKESPIPLQRCPWCGLKFTPPSFKLEPDARQPEDLRIQCLNTDCDFTVNRNPLGLPIVAVDEPLYKRIPCFMIATADKFAALPWRGEPGVLFGKVTRYDEERYYGPHDPGLAKKRPGKKLKQPLPPPDLVIQDELHLISGPLGTMAGLYETALDALMRADTGYGPKIVASTATVRRAESQIQALFGRERVSIFPPPGLNRDDIFFAKTDTAHKDRARLYLGVAAQGRSLKVSLLRSYLALLAAANKRYLEHGGADNPNNPADPYMTVLGYFNTLRELGGTRRIVEDEIASRLTNYSVRKRMDETTGSFANRPKLREVVELTSRVATHKVAKGKARLAEPHHAGDSVDVALATNMIQVGLDIVRLGLMVVLGQPKSTSEYIQATSRVGRDPNRPGLVVNLLNIHRPRDRSHYENFGFWHACFYRSVEINSVTPFSARALDRGLAAVVVALARHLIPELTPPNGAAYIETYRGELTERIAAILTERVRNHQPMDAEEGEKWQRFFQDRVAFLLQTWGDLAKPRGNRFAYDKRDGYPLLHDAGRIVPNQFKAGEEHFTAQWSMREVEPKTNLFIHYPTGYGKENMT